ncbi:threonine ammonia-lyase IlvA [Kiloniella sp. b19]|uniref:threonine ammonia-lyase IlvA n=1 Tax=Kiloniella sp. GXU_MW_B19 TaxID=3141326 RepID=UPI0031E27360
MSDDKTNKNFVTAVEDAKETLRGQFKPTPLWHNAFLSERYGCDIYLKREDTTPVRSYKIRGAFNFFERQIRRHGTGDSKPAFACASAGNHAQGFAYACAAFGCQGTIFMPVTTPQQKIQKTKAFGRDFVTIRLVGDIFDEALAAAIDHCDQSGSVMVPPFDHEDIITGQATVALEVLDQLDNKQPDLVIMPVGGGGLSAGMTRYLSEKSPDTGFLFVEPEGAPSLRTSLEEGRQVTLGKVDNFVDGAAVARIGDAPFKQLSRFSSDQVMLIPEDRLCNTMEEFLNIEGIVLEPAGALAIDALRELDYGALKGKTIVCVVSGGNFDFERLPEVKERALKYASLKKYFILRMPQRPGALKDFLFLLGPDDDITRFEYLKKSARNFGSILIGIQTNAPENFKILTRKFEESGIQYQDITENEIISNLIV